MECEPRLSRGQATRFYGMAVRSQERHNSPCVCVCVNVCVHGCMYVCVFKGYAGGTFIYKLLSAGLDSVHGYLA